MGRPRTGSIYHRNNRAIARVTWTDEHGKRRDKKKTANSREHAEVLLAQMLSELPQTPESVDYFPTYQRTDLSIYCIQMLDGGIQPIKIGIARNVKSRISTLLTSIPYELKLLASWPARSHHERLLHGRFREARMAREWFRPTPELLAFIEEKRANPQMGI